MAKDTLDDAIDSQNNSQMNEKSIRKQFFDFLEKSLEEDISEEEYEQIQDLASNHPQVAAKVQEEFNKREDVQEKLKERQEQQQQQQQEQVQQLRHQIDLLRLGDNQLTETGAYSKLRADREEAEFLSQGGKKILHFTDTEVEARDLEHRLQKLLHDEGVLQHVMENGSLPDNTLLVHTGDIGPDLFNTQKHRYRAFLPDIVIEEGELSGENAQEFKHLYHEFMDEAGLTEEVLISGPKTQEEQQALQQFINLLYGHVDPNFKTQEEIKDFQAKRAKLHSHLEDAIENHAQRNMQEIKQVFDKYGLDSSNFVIVSGNHDVPHVVENTFQDSYLKQGETREVKGVKFNRPLGGATGSIYGPMLARNLMGSTELTEQIPQMRIHSESFNELYDYVTQDLGFDHISRQEADRLIKMSIRKAQVGLPTGDLKQINERIENEVQHQIRQRLQKIPQSLDESADVYLGHGDITHPQHAGVEEVYLSKLLDGKGREGKFYMGGHEHGETTNQLNGMLYLNPGASRDSYAHAAVYVDNSNRFLAQKRSAITPDQKTDLMYRKKGEIASQSVQRQGGDN
ncbi:MAG: hypothetical protein ACLFPL_05000 [Candidatus Nanoarchaeia archaeon]